VDFLVEPPDRRGREVDNLMKVVKDALTDAGFWVDDSNKVIRKGSWEWAAPGKGAVLGTATGGTDADEKNHHSGDQHSGACQRPDLVRCRDRVITARAVVGMWPSIEAQPEDRPRASADRSETADRLHDAGTGSRLSAARHGFQDGRLSGKCGNGLGCRRLDGVLQLASRRSAAGTCRATCRRPLG